MLPVHNMALLSERTTIIMTVWPRTLVTQVTGTVKMFIVNREHVKEMEPGVVGILCAWVKYGVICDM